MEAGGSSFEGEFLLALRYDAAGETEAAERACQKIVASDPGHAYALHLLGMIASRRGDLGAAVEQFSAAVRSEPGIADFHSTLGQILVGLGQGDEGVASFRRASALAPDRADFYQALGAALVQVGRPEEAVGCYRRGGVLRPGEAVTHYGLGSALLAQGDLGPAMVELAKSIVIRPELANAHSALGFVLQCLGRPGDAALCYRRALACDPDLADAQLNFGLLHLLVGDFPEGWCLFKKGRKIKSYASKLPEWDGGDIAGKTNILHCEKGAGDSIQLIRYERAVAELGANIVLGCPPPLVRLFNELPGVTRMVTELGDPPGCECQASLLALPLLFGTVPTTIPGNVPYLKADPASARMWGERLAYFPGVKVGIVWRGNPRHRRDRLRSIRPEVFARFLCLPGLSVISLQQDASLVEIAALGVAGRFLNAAPELGDFADTAALIANLDLVISVDTAVCHLAGALGKPVWTLIDHGGCWRWQVQREDSPWYPSMRLFRQPEPGAWDPVAETVRRRLIGEYPGVDGRGHLST